MAKKFTALDALASPVSTDLLAVVSSPASSAVTKKSTIAAILNTPGCFPTGMHLDLATDALLANSVFRAKGYSPAYELLDKDGAQNFYMGIDDDDGNKFVIGRGYGPGQKIAGVPIARSISINPTTLVVSIGSSAPTAPQGVFSVQSDDSYGANDWVAWFRRTGSTGGGVSAHMRLQHFRAGASPEPVFSFLAARGSLASPSAVLAGDLLGVIDARGFDGSAVDHTEYAVGWSDGMTGWAMHAAGNWSGTSHPSYQRWYVTPDASVTAVTALTLDSDGNFNYGTNPATAGLLRLPNAKLIAFRNAANDANVEGLQVNLSNVVILGDTSFDLLLKGAKHGFFGTPAVVKQTSGADLTNSVTSGGSSDVIANYTDLSTYATDAAAIRNNIYQLARKVKQINDGLRAYGLFT